MLTQAKNIAVGVFEPGDLGAAGGRPNPALILSGKTVAFKVNSTFREAGDEFLDVRDLPTRA